MWQTADKALRKLASTAFHILTGSTAGSFACLKGNMSFSPPSPAYLESHYFKDCKNILPAWLASAPHEWGLFASE